MEPGTRIKLLHMSDPYPLPPGSIGTVIGTDDLGDYLVSWDCGSTLKLIPGVDEWEVIDESIIDSGSCST